MFWICRPFSGIGSRRVEPRVGASDISASGISASGISGISVVRVGFVVRVTSIVRVRSTVRVLGSQIAGVRWKHLTLVLRYLFFWSSSDMSRVRVVWRSAVFLAAHWSHSTPLRREILHEVGPWNTRLLQSGWSGRRSLFISLLRGWGRRAFWLERCFIRDSCVTNLNNGRS